MSALEPNVSSAPDLIRPVVGFRQWDLSSDGLRSPFHGDVWDRTELHASCARSRHDLADVPATECGCGVYAYYSQPPRSATATWNTVIGAVVLWGAIELHAMGMRAEHARIVGLALPLPGWRKRQRLITIAEQLQVPAVPLRQLAAVADGHGAPMPPRLRPSGLAVPWERPMGILHAAGDRRTRRS